MLKHVENYRRHRWFDSQGTHIRSRAFAIASAAVVAFAYCRLAAKNDEAIQEIKAFEDRRYLAIIADDTARLDELFGHPLGRGGVERFDRAANK